jgi:magnesium transporter
LRKPGNIDWIDVDSLHNLALIAQIGEQFNLDPLVLEDIMSEEQLPKFDDLHQYIFVSLKMLSQEKNGIKHEQVSFVLGANFLISFQSKPGDVFSPVRKRIANPQGRHRRKGADYLLYSLIDVVVDNYFIIAEHLGERVAELELQVNGRQNKLLVHHITELKREFIFLRKVLFPLREVIRKLATSENDLIEEGNAKYFNDVLDHVNQVIQDLEAQRDLISGVTELYNSSLNFRMSNVIKTLTVITTVFIPLTFIAGVYGMNFKHMPELDWKWGYPVVLFGMLVLGVGMFVWMKRRDWL